ncbi:hypothetical protein B0A49_08348 [Cryomyces minteri]|uniref:SET domain-containing protein n=1 Tax=Cryomyces minteri TaxID=331657 RepID=A0A4U0WRU0_9PEZI|nr:hypothetical protein B0A49_08348 [Cryomyces minteri]
MAATAELEQWLKAYGGHLHPAVILDHDASTGVCLRATAAIAPETRICTVPFSLSLSYLNALAPGPDVTIWEQLSANLEPEVISRFFLLHQYLNIEDSFWESYIATLPSPSAGFDTPFYFTDEDIVWLQGTDVEQAFKTRAADWRQKWVAGVEILKTADLSWQQYTWELFVWAASVYTSRSFASNTLLRPNYTEYSAYRKDGTGLWQLCSLQPPESMKEPFAMLFPVMDASNHSHSVKAEWSLDETSFGLSLRNEVKAGDQVWNNYGPKPNDELLMGYGFCIPGNPFDRVAMTLKALPPIIQARLRQTNSQLFSLPPNNTSSSPFQSSSTEGSSSKTPLPVWNLTAATFYLPGPQYRKGHYSHDMPFWRSFSSTLIEILFYLFFPERGIELPNDPAFITGPERKNIDVGLYCRAYGCRYIMGVSRIMIRQLTSRLTKITQFDDTLPAQPQNERQGNAKIYRDGQVEILKTGIGELTSVIHYFHRRGDNEALNRFPGTTHTLSSTLSAYRLASPSRHRAFTTGLRHVLGTAELAALCDAGWEADIWTLWLCWIWVEVASRSHATSGTEVGNNDERDEDDDDDEVAIWVKSLSKAYLPSVLARVRAFDDADTAAGAVEEETAAKAEELLALVREAAQRRPQSLWASPWWSEQLVALWGCRIVVHEGDEAVAPR